MGQKCCFSFVTCMMHNLTFLMWYYTFIVAPALSGTLWLCDSWRRVIGAEGGQVLNIGQGWWREKRSGATGIWFLAPCQRGLGCSNLCDIWSFFGPSCAPGVYSKSKTSGSLYCFTVSLLSFFVWVLKSASVYYICYRQAAFEDNKKQLRQNIVYIA